MISLGDLLVDHVGKRWPSVQFAYDGLWMKGKGSEVQRLLGVVQGDQFIFGSMKGDPWWADGYDDPMGIRLDVHLDAREPDFFEKFDIRMNELSKYFA